MYFSIKIQFIDLIAISVIIFFLSEKSIEQIKKSSRTQMTYLEAKIQWERIIIH